MSTGIQEFRRRVVSLVLPVVDLLAAPFVYLAARLLRLVRRMSYARMPLSGRAIDRANIYPLIDHYYEPLFNLARLKRPLSAVRNLPGVNLNETAALQYLARIARPQEIRELYPWTDDGSGGFHFDNDMFSVGDAEVLHGIIRTEKPRTIAEIGCGWSSRIVSRALALNASEGGARARQLCIEPHPPADFNAPGAELITRSIEEFEISPLLALGRGDILFIDSSHMIRPQGDVLFEMQEIVPRLAHGVLIHVHDIFTPRDYADNLIRQHRVFWNEQYLVETFLAHSREFEVVLPLNHLWHAHRQAVALACPRLAERPDAEPASFWIRRR